MLTVKCWFEQMCMSFHLVILVTKIHKTLDITHVMYTSTLRLLHQFMCSTVQQSDVNRVAIMSYLKLKLNFNTMADFVDHWPCISLEL